MSQKLLILHETDARKRSQTVLVSQGVHLDSMRFSLTMNANRREIGNHQIPKERVWHELLCPRRADILFRKVSNGQQLQQVDMDVTKDMELSKVMDLPLATSQGRAAGSCFNAGLLYMKLIL